MASSPLADTAALASWLGVSFDSGSQEESRAGTVIQVISGFARSEAARPDWTLENVPEDVSAVVLLAAVRSWVNPDGKTSVTMDDVTRRWERGTMFDANEIRTLRKYRKSSGGLSSLQFTNSVGETTAVTAVEGGQSVILYDGRGY